MATRCPGPQASAIRWPGRKLAAGLLILVRPSGNRMVLDTTAAGWAIRTGPSTASGTAIVASASQPAARLPSRAATRARATASAGHAVAFMAAARPRARPARMIRSTGRRLGRAPAAPGRNG